MCVYTLYPQSCTRVLCVCTPCTLKAAHVFCVCVHRVPSNLHMRQGELKSELQFNIARAWANLTQDASLRRCFLLPQRSFSSFHAPYATLHPCPISSCTHAPYPLPLMPHILHPCAAFAFPCIHVRMQCVNASTVHTRSRIGTHEGRLRWV